MPKNHRNGPDTGAVEAARAGERRALDHLVTECLPLVYNIVGRALNGHADVDDVVQETLLRMVRGLPELRDPSAFRSWLVAITIRQVRDRERGRARARDRDAQLEEADSIADPALDFAGLTILRLGLTEQRRETAEATRWLDPDDQELLSLWWLEETGELDRTEVASALGLSDRHAAVRIGRMKKQMELSRLVVRALAAAPRCAGLNQTAATWDSSPGPLWRKRFARHIRSCPVCTGVERELLPMDRLLSGLPLLAVPPGLDPGGVLAVVIGGGTAPSGEPSAEDPASGPSADSPVPSPGPGTGDIPQAAHTAEANHHRATRRHRAHRSSRGRTRAVTPVLGGAAVAVVAVAALLATRLVTGTSAPAAETALPAPSTPTATASPSPPAKVSASPTASPHRTHPTAEPTRTVPGADRAPAPATAPAPAQVTSSAKKGVGVWSFDGVSQALSASGASWYYTWSPQHAGVTTPPSAAFVPMIWGADSVTDAALAQARTYGPYLLGFNEPDMEQQSNMTVEQSLELWPQLMKAGKVLGSPAVATGADVPGGWLDRFMSGAAARGHRVDFITLHWYGSDFRTPQAVDQLKSYLRSVHQRYHKPIWLTEYALIDFSNGTRFPTPAQQAAFITASTEALGSLPYLQRYAWFGLGADPSKPSSGLFTNGTATTTAGRAFRAAH